MMTPPRPTHVTVNHTAFMYCQASYDHKYDITHVWKLNGKVIDFRLSPEFYDVCKLNKSIRIYNLIHIG